ncbi:hypothetical protein D3C87_1688760 [compost metagenome]
MPGRNHLSNPHRRTFAEIVDVWLECQAKAGNFYVAGAFAAVSEKICHRRFNLIHNPMRFAVVHFTCGADQTRLVRVLRHDEPRVNRDTVAADTRAGLKNIDARMAICQTDKFPDVNPLIGANQRQFIGERDVDITEAVFRQLAHFSRAGVSDHTLAFKEDVIKLAGTR